MSTSAGEGIGSRSDLFSFGAVLYEMATGTLPFRGESSGVIFKAILDAAPISPVRLNADVRAELEHIIAKALEKDRETRYQHASDMRADLKRLKRETEAGRLGTTTVAAADSRSPSSTANVVPHLYRVAARAEIGEELQRNVKRRIFLGVRLWSQWRSSIKACSSAELWSRFC